MIGKHLKGVLSFVACCLERERLLAGKEMVGFDVRHGRDPLAFSMTCWVLPLGEGELVWGVHGAGVRWQNKKDHGEIMGDNQICNLT